MFTLSKPQVYMLSLLGVVLLLTGLVISFLIVTATAPASVRTTSFSFKYPNNWGRTTPNVDVTTLVNQQTKDEIYISRADLEGEIDAKTYANYVLDVVTEDATTSPEVLDLGERTLYTKDSTQVAAAVIRYQYTDATSGERLIAEELNAVSGSNLYTVRILAGADTFAQSYSVFTQVLSTLILAK